MTTAPNPQDDKELLELAARAAGYPLSSEWDSAASGIMIGYGVGDLATWNPLVSDGDALRLAVRLRIDLTFFRNSTEAAVETCLSEEAINDAQDEREATRRAIVRAAAEIARQESSHGID